MCTSNTQGFCLRPSVNFKDWISECWGRDSGTFCPVFCSSSYNKASSSWKLERSPNLLCFYLYVGSALAALPVCRTLLSAGPGSEAGSSSHTLAHPAPGDFFQTMNGLSSGGHLGRRKGTPFWPRRVSPSSDGPEGSICREPCLGSRHLAILWLGPEPPYMTPLGLLG